MTLRYDDESDVNLFCLYSITQLRCFVDPRNYRLGDDSCFLPAKNYLQFRRRLSQAAEQHPLVRRMRSGPVEYVSREFHSGKMGPFRKYDDYAYQSEVRFAFYPGLGEPLILRLGSLRDLLITGTAASFNNYFTLNYNLLPAKTA